MRGSTGRVRAVLVAVIATVLLGGAAPAVGAADVAADESGPAAARTVPAGRAVVRLPLREAIGRLSVADEDRAGYDRGEFGSGWIDADRDGCSTRAEVLLAEAVTEPTVTGRCTLTGGSWYSWYDEQTVTATDIDHVVPLAEAWDSGARLWSRQKRITYANYLDDPRHLEAVSQRSNRQKADQDVAEWLPVPSARCRYLTYWVPIKLTWNLSVDQAELRALNALAASCPNSQITYTPVP